MFDTMTLTKIAAALCSALLVFVLGGWIADKIYSPAHHGEYHGVAWIETDSGEEDDEAEAEDGPMLEDLLASADLEKGAKVLAIHTGGLQGIDGFNKRFGKMIF